MSLEDWANNGWLRTHKSSAQEIADLLAIVERDLADAGGTFRPIGVLVLLTTAH